MTYPTTKIVHPGETARDLEALAAATLDALTSLQNVGVIGAGARGVLERLAGLSPHSKRQALKEQEDE